MTARYVSLSGYPISRTYRETLERSLGEVPEYHTLPELRQLSPWALFSTLRSTRPHTLLLPIEDETARPLVSILRLLGAVTRAKRIELVDTDLSRSAVSRLGAAWSFATLIWGTLTGYVSLLIARRDAARLLPAARIAVSSERTGRVLYLKTNLWMGLKAGGSVGHVAGVVNALSRADCGVEYLSTDAPVMLDEAVAVERVKPNASFGVPAEVNLYRYNRQLLQQTWKTRKHARYRFIYQRLSLCSYQGVVLSRRLRLPLIVEYNGSEVWAARNWGSRLRYEKTAQQLEDMCLKHAHLVVTVSEVAAQELRRRGVEPHRIVTYPNCIDPLIFDPERFGEQEVRRVRERIDVSADALVITFVGTFGRWHGAEVFARAIRSLIDESAAWLRSRSIRFLFVGDGLSMPEVKRVLDGETAAEFVRYAGLVPQAEAPAYLAASDIFVSPHVPNPDGTPFFGSPTKLFEYMAMQRCIVASRLEQIADVLDGSPDAAELVERDDDVSAEACAVLVQPASVDELCAAIRIVAERPRLRAGLAENARRRVLQRYTWDKHVAAILTGLENSLSAP